MTPAERLEAARTEIARRKVIARAATPGPWTVDLGGVDDLHFGRVSLPVLRGPDTYGPKLADTEHMAANNPEHVLAVLEIHRLMLALADPWLLGRLDQPGPITDPVRAVLDLYCPKETADA